MYYSISRDGVAATEACLRELTAADIADGGKKYLIEHPDIAWLESLPNCQQIEIIQTYLNSAKNEKFGSVIEVSTDTIYIFRPPSVQSLSSSFRTKTRLSPSPRR